jgi:carbon storage regulator CsrA
MSNAKTSNLIFSRRLGESAIVGEGANAVTVTVVGFQGNQVKLSFAAPRGVAIDREEIRKRKQESPMY